MSKLLIDIPIKLPISLPPVSVMDAYGDSETDYEIKAWENDEISQQHLEEITKEIKECDTKNELNELQTSRLKTKKEKPQSDNKNNN